MKILHLTKKYPPGIGGDAFTVYNLKKQQVKSGHEVHVAASNCAEAYGEEILKFGLREANQDRVTPRRVLSLVLLALWGFKHLRRLKPDVVHSHSADLGFFISIAARLYGIPVVNTCHGISFNDAQYSFLKRSAEKFFLKYGGFRKVIAVDVKGMHALKDTKIDTACVPNGTDLARFGRQEKKSGTRTRFLFVGRLEKQKGVIYLIKAAEVLKDEKDFEVIIIGDGSEAEHLREAVQRLGLEGFFKFKGRVDEQMLLEHYQACDAFVLPSLWEGMPLTLLEAAAAGMPIVASDVGGISSLFVHEVNALIVEPKDIRALASAMLKLADDEKLREKLGRNARELAEKFSWENTAKALEEIYMQPDRGLKQKI